MKKLLLFLILACNINLFSQAPQLKLLGHWRDPSIVGSAQYDNAFNEAYGFTVNGHEYGIIGSTYGWHIIDVTDPTKPFERMRVKGGTSDPSVIHRDFRYFKCHIYAVCDEGENSTLQILDVSNLPDTAQLVYDSKELFYRSHNIYIDESKAKLYTSAEKNAQGFFALGMYDLSNPAKPVLIGHFNKFGNITANHVHDCFVRNDTAYLHCGNDGFAIMDFKDPSNAKPLFTLLPNEFQYSGYNHSGWLTPDGKTYVMADENHGSPLKVLNLTDWDNIKIVSYLWANKDTAKCIPHNPLLSCSYAYVSYYYDGLQVFNIEDPFNPTLAGYYPTSTEYNWLNYKGAWGTYPFLPSGNIIVADMQNGMFIVEGPEKVCNPENQCILNGIDESNPENVRIFPNPVNQLLQIELANNITNVRLYTLSGVELLTQSNNNHSKIWIEMNNLTNGFYILSIQFNNGKILKQKIVRS